MRPMTLSALFAQVQQLDGIGPKLAEKLARLVNNTVARSDPRVIDLLWHFPSGITDRRQQPRIAEAIEGTIATIKVRVASHAAPPRGNKKIPYRVTCADESGEMDLVFFRGQKNFMERLLPVGELRIASGRVEHYAGKLQMTHPDHVVSEEEFKTLELIEPVYPLMAGVSNKIMRRGITNAIELIPPLEEWQDEAWLKQNKWPSFEDALRMVHLPQDYDDLLPNAPARQRLAFDELLASQLALALMRNSEVTGTGRALLIKNNGLRDKIISKLPFKLTGSQEHALDEIYRDMASKNRMLRLLQGDVGSGKTVVALLAMAATVEAGAQAALMAPTEVLARQHFADFQEIAEQSGFSVALLTGREKGKTRLALLEALQKGEIDMLIGTHALFQKDVEFADLGLAVIDEQHRFGVQQRMALQAKGKNTDADVLVMTATPIPRTLLLTNYGDMESSQLTDKPAGRKPITTRVLPVERIDEVLHGLERALATGTQIYWVCPLVEESEHIDLAAADQRHAWLKRHFGEKVGLVHGQMKSDEKDAVMQDFTDGKLGLLVATTVIEVGVNVPNATIMVIEHAERFGLSQLHQLRGRVGRGDQQSSCILLYQGPLSKTGQSRLKVIRDSEDGFRIAEEDLRLRGGGELLGTRQSGLPGFGIAQLPEHGDLLSAARDDAELILLRDPTLSSPRGVALKTLLYLFERDAAAKLLRSG
ncbi:MAG: ATP-dependent DNA helicase RecG [Hyphomicrobiaceae bacterium]|nr:ATP-dependent DNA helicase RecG [Hyphomicrobiaceae bacterium]